MISQRSVVACVALMVLLAALSGTSFAQRQASQPAVIPSPKSVLGFTPGDDRTIAGWSQITDYFERLDRASDRVLVQTLGQSTLKRPLIVAFISARENILALPKYKEIQQQLADPRRLTSTLQRDRLFANGKVVVTISCSIHSTEIVASQMSMQLAYELATAQDPDTRAILQNTILLLIPSPNPDGIDIVANWYRKTLGTPYEGKEPPELYHHYAGHDDNRDWFMLNLKETQLITHLLWQEWFPEIVYDVHQQGTNGSRLFIPPFYDPPNPNIAPLLLRQVGLIGHKVAADLEAAGFKGVLTNALYDTWWHGGFRTAPYFHNSIGILSEAASAHLMTPITITTEQLARSSTRGMRNAIEATTNFPDPWPAGEWHPRDIMAMELVSSRSILELASKFRSEYLHNFFELGRTSIESSHPGEPQAYVIPAGQARDEAVAKMIGALIDQGVEVFRLDRELHAILATPVVRRTNPVAEKVGSYRRLASLTSSSMQEVPAGSYIIFLAQPQRTNVLALFEPQIYPNRLTAQGEAERPYDVAGWTLPLQMNVAAPAVVAIKEPPSERKLTLLKDANEVRADLALPLKKGDESPIKNPVKQPVRVGIYKGSMGNMDEGWTRYVFDTFNVPYSSVRDADMKQGSLNAKFDALILPSQTATQIVNGNAAGTFPPEYTGGMTDAGVKNLKEFVTNGGMLICFDNACDLAIKEFNLPLRNVLEGVRSSEFYCPGSVVALDVDNKNPIAATLPPNVPAYFINSSAFAAATADANVRVVARYAKENVLLSGWLLGEDRLRGQIALAEVSVGKGRIVLFGFRPQHRGQTWGTLPFIWNALSSAAVASTEE
ncbi:MAG TPA: M14 metallopeptidase family protein [Pyrinomonadaceae bacterium]|nr:M14 metallopeptidase family protein [Pyrinomonadaceae bacterium]